MTVEDLIDELEQMPPTAMVFVMIASDGAFSADIFNVEYDKGECLIIFEPDESDNEPSTEDGPE